MIVFVYDTETTGLEPEAHRIIQHGVVAYDIVHRKAVDFLSILVWGPDYPAVAESKKVHGWEKGLLEKYATTNYKALSLLSDFYSKYHPIAVAAHNAKFDFNMLAAEAKRYAAHWKKENDFECEVVYESPLQKLPWIDTVAFPYDSPSKNLLTLCAAHGFLNPFPHNALFDAVSLCRILDNYPFQRFVDIAAEPQMLVFARVPQDYDLERNAVLKSHGFRWKEFNGHVYPKSWIQVIPSSKFAELGSRCPFPVNLIKELPVEEKILKLKARLDSYFEPVEAT